MCEKGAFVDAETRVGVDDDGVWSVGGVAVHCFLGSVFPCPHINVLLLTVVPILEAFVAGIFGDEVAVNGGDVEACSLGEVVEFSQVPSPLASLWIVFPLYAGSSFGQAIPRGLSLSGVMLSLSFPP